ncbi:MAG: hypothetical protein PWP50_1249, partial [Synergistaceae bacterium]|nr:hypothetical protein [Synergistaceae bacterium]
NSVVIAVVGGIVLNLLINFILVPLSDRR